LADDIYEKTECNFTGLKNYAGLKIEASWGILTFFMKAVMAE